MKASGNQKASQRTINGSPAKELMPTIDEEERSPVGKINNQHERRRSRFSGAQDSQPMEAGYNQGPGHEVKSMSQRKLPTSGVLEDGQLPQVKLLRSNTNISLYSDRPVENKNLESLHLRNSKAQKSNFDPSKLDALNFQLKAIEEKMENIRMVRKKREEEVIAQQNLLKETNQRLLNYSSEVKQSTDNKKMSILNSEDIAELRREIAKLMADNQYLKQTVQAKDNKIEHVTNELRQMTLARSIALERNEVLMNEIQMLRKENNYLKREETTNKQSLQRSQYDQLSGKAFVFNSAVSAESRVDSGRHENKNIPQSSTKTWRDSSPDLSRLVRSNRAIKRSVRKINSPAKHPQNKSPESTNRQLPQLDPKALQRSRQLGGPELDGYTLWLANTKDMEFLHPTQKAKRERAKIN